MKLYFFIVSVLFSLSPQLNDCVILDPMCGVGAVLLEAAQEYSVSKHITYTKLHMQIFTHTIHIWLTPYIVYGFRILYF